MSAPEITPQASPATSTPWVPLWPLGGQTMGELAYAEITASVNITATTEAGAQTIATAPAVTLDGSTPIVIEFNCVNVGPASGQALVLTLWDGSTDLGQIGLSNSGSLINVPVLGRRRLTPSAGAHTYSVRGHVSSGTGIINAGAGGAGVAGPAGIRITTASPISNAPAGALLPVQYGTSLPASPVDGQEAILVDSLTNPAYQWRFRLNAARATNKWEFIGGAAAFSYIAAYESTGSTAYIALPTPGPLFAIPITGIYAVEVGFSADGDAGGWLQMSYDIGGTGASDLDSCWISVQSAGSRDAGITAARMTLTPLTLTAKYRCSGASTFYWGKRFMRVTPVAVGG